MVDTTNRLAGIAYLTIDGTSYPLVEFSYDPSTVTRESQSGMDGVHGYKETPKPGKMKAKIRDAGNLSVQTLSNLTNSTVVAELANGKTIVGRNMWSTEPPEVDTAEATFELSFEGPSVTEN